MGIWGAALQGVLGVDSSIQTGIAERKQSLANIDLANTAATDAYSRGAREAGQIRESGTQLAGQQLAAFSSSGVDATVGTPADLQASTRAQTELAALQTQNNAAREAWGYKKHGIAFQAQAGIDAARTNREVAGGILSTAGNVAGAYSKTGWGV